MSLNTTGVLSENEIDTLLLMRNRIEMVRASGNLSPDMKALQEKIDQRFFAHGAARDAAAAERETSSG